MTISPLKRPSIEPRELRDACGDWVTGVAIVTSVDQSGRPVGMAVNSFTSLSLEPPLILFCPAWKSSTWPKIRDEGRFVVNILSSSQGALTRSFAQPGGNKFAGVEYRIEDGLPVLHGSATNLTCTLVNTFDGGDHEIAIGRVDSLSRSWLPPLVFHRGGIVTTVEGLSGES